MKVIFKVPSINDGRFKRWAKILTRVDTSKTDGYAFLGEFVTIDKMIEVEAGTLILFFGREGSMKHNSPYVTLYRIGEDGNKTTLFEKGMLNEAWALEVRDEIAQIVNQRKDIPGYEIKTFELRDNATTIHVMAVKVNLAVLNLADKMQFLGAGWAEDEDRLIYVIELPEPCRAAYNPFEWDTSARTFPDAHLYIRDHWDEIPSGHVVDVEYINGETEKEKANEWLCHE